MKSQSLTIKPSLEFLSFLISKRRFMGFDPIFGNPHDVLPISRHDFPNRFPMIFLRRRYDLARRDAGSATLSRCIRVMKDQQLGRFHQGNFHHGEYMVISSSNMVILPGNYGGFHQETMGDFTRKLWGFTMKRDQTW
jgi:hypothetical protein